VVAEMYLFITEPVMALTKQSCVASAVIQRQHTGYTSFPTRQLQSTSCMLMVIWSHYCQTWLQPMHHADIDQDIYKASGSMFNRTASDPLWVHLQLRCIGGSYLSVMFQFKRCIYL